jgi:hypothetical protein
MTGAGIGLYGYLAWELSQPVNLLMIVYIMNTAAPGGDRPANRTDQSGRGRDTLVQRGHLPSPPFRTRILLP